MDEKRLTEALQQFRALAHARAPRPSKELSARLDMQMLERLPAASSATQLAVVNASARPGRLRAVLSWLAGLGVVAKIVLGVAVAAAAATGAGAAGVLPGAAQQVFDTVLPGLAPHAPSPIADDPSGDATPPGLSPTAVPGDEDGTGAESEGDGAGKPADTPGNGGEGTGKPEDTPGNGGDGTGKPEGTPGNGGEGTGKPDNTPGGNPNK